MIQYTKNLHYNTHNNFSHRFYALLILINSYEKKNSRINKFLNYNPIIHLIISKKQFQNNQY